jgi:hypothetical protein
MLFGIIGVMLMGIVSAETGNKQIEIPKDTYDKFVEKGITGYEVQNISCKNSICQAKIITNERKFRIGIPRYTMINKMLTEKTDEQIMTEIDSKVIKVLDMQIKAEETPKKTIVGKIIDFIKEKIK